MVLPTADTPLYNHPLPDIETWLRQQGCEQNTEAPTVGMSIAPCGRQM